MLRQCRLYLAGDIGDIGDVHFDTIGTEIKKILSIYIFLWFNDRGHKKR
jgi:hypothetical protein